MAEIAKSEGDELLEAYRELAEELAEEWAAVRQRMTQSLARVERIYRAVKPAIADGELP